MEKKHFFFIASSVLVVIFVISLSVPKTLGQTTQASTNPPTSTFRLQPTKSAFEQYTNPFGEAWINKASYANEDIPNSFSYTQTANDYTWLNIELTRA